MQLLLFLLFILKLFLGMVLFKFLMILKSMKLLLIPQFMVLLGLPVVTAILSPFVLTTIFSIPGKIMNIPRDSVNSTLHAMHFAGVPYSKMLPIFLSTFLVALSAALRPTNPSTTTSSLSSSLSRLIRRLEPVGGLTSSFLLGSRPSTSNSSNKLSNSTAYEVYPENLIPHGLAVNKHSVQNFSKTDDLNLLYNWYNKSSSSLSKDLHTPDLTQNVLDSEKCVEKIACRLAVSENTGITPPRINW